MLIVLICPESSTSGRKFQNIKMIQTRNYNYVGPTLPAFIAYVVSDTSVPFEGLI